MSTYRNGGLFVLLSVLWGTAFVAIKAGLAFVPPVLFAAVRYDVAGVLMLGYAAYATDYWRPRSRGDWVTVLIGATLVIALYNAFLFLGEQGVTSAVAAVLVATNPILATGFSRVVLPEERLTAVGAAGLLLGFVGVGLVVRPDPSNLLAGTTASGGLVFLAAVCVALGSVLIERVESAVPVEATVAWSTALGAVVLHGISFGLLAESAGRATFTPAAVAAVAYLAVFASAVGYLVYFDLLDRLGAVEINLVSYAAPVVAAIAGWALLDEVVDPLSAVGFLVIVAGFALVKRRALREEFESIGSRPERG